MTTPALPPDARIVIAGAGAIGVYIGAKAAAQGRRVAFLGRERFVEAARAQGVAAIDPDGRIDETPAARIDASAEPGVLAGADIILVAVRSRDTEAMAETIMAWAPSEACVVSLQNGVRNAERLREGLPRWDVRAGMVPYNVVLDAPNRARRATAGASYVQSGARAGLGALLDAPGAEMIETDDILAIQWGKVLVNLNNALNALSGKPLIEQLSDRDWRRVWAACQDEGLAAMRAAGIAPASALPGPPPAYFPTLLRLPTWAFRRIAARAFKVSPSASSSMQDDLRRGRTTEIDDLQGEIIRLAEAHGLGAPMNAAVLAAIRAAEAAGAGPPGLTPTTLLDAAKA